MKNYFNLVYLLFFTIIISCNSLPMTAQSSHNPIEYNLNNTIFNLEKEDSIYLSNDMKHEFINAYSQKLLSYKNNNLNKKIDENVLSYYSQPTGMKAILSTFILNTDKSEKKILSIENILDERIYVNVDGNSIEIEPNLINNYATLLIQMEPENSDTSLYLNDRFICLAQAAKNGILVHSRTNYKIEFKINDKVICSSNTVFEDQEKKISKCIYKK